MATVVVGTAVGLAAGGRLPERMGRTLMQVLGLTTFLVGTRMAWALDGLHAGPVPGIILALVSLAVGGLLGEAARLEERLASLGEVFRRRFRGTGRFDIGSGSTSVGSVSMSEAALAGSAEERSQ